MQLQLSVGLFALCAVCTSDVPARTISTNDELIRSLQRAQAGEVFALAPGVYDDVRIAGFHGTATIASLDPKHPAQIHHLLIRDSSGLTLRDLELVAELANPAVGWRWPFVVVGSSRIVLKNLDVHSVPGSALSTENGGLLVRDSDHIVVADSDFHDLHMGIQHWKIENLEIRGNKLRQLRDDGIDGGGSSNVMIADNHCSSQHPDADDKEHPDCIQFWTTNTTEAAHDITVENNTYDRGSGTPVQGIFFNDEAGHPYQRVTIVGNHISGALWNGIYVRDAEDLIIEDNVVCDAPGQASWITLMSVRGATLVNNFAGLFQFNASSISKNTGSKVGHCKA
ncbi:MAG TPA: right-handed parallel beta-helix repeat-containing protein [Caulobacteraceae bacterium]|jgi:hypothetical protein|nr:right-handed parallel beta-helix repeat-containing protein [Caulobacteraceae bacterium]